MGVNPVIGDGNSSEIVEHMVIDEAANCCMDVEVSNEEVQDHKTNGGINENIHDLYLVAMTPLVENKHMAANVVILNKAYTETSAGNVLETCDDLCNSSVIPPVDSQGVTVRVANEASTICQGSCDIDVLAVNRMTEQHNKTEELRSNVDEYDMASSKENIVKGQGVPSSDDSFGRHSPVHVGFAEQSLASDADATLNQSGVVSEAVSCCVDYDMCDKEVQTKQSNENANAQVHEPYMVSTSPLEENPHMAAKDIALSLVSSEVGAGVLIETSGNLHSSGVTPSYEASVTVANSMSTVSQSSDVLAMNIEREKHSETKDLCSTVDKSNMGSSEDDVDKGQRNSSHVDCGDQSFASDAGTSLTQLGVLNAVASQSESGTVSITADGALSCSTRKKLLVLDVNGLLADISSYVPYDFEPDEILCKKAVFKRPFCNDFLNFCLERFNVGVWSSRTRRNMEPIVDFLLGNAKGRVLFHWDQSHCTYTGFNTIEKRDKPLLVKKLTKLWDKHEPSLPWEKGDYNESNTLLIDDSPYKALCNPRYTAIFPYTYRFRNARDNSLGPEGDLRLYLERLAMAENVQEFVKANPFGQRAITEKNLSWGYYSKVIAAANTSPPRENMFGLYAVTQKKPSWGYQPRVNVVANSYPRPRQNAEVSSNPWGITRFWS